MAANLCLVENICDIYLILPFDKFDLLYTLHFNDGFINY